MTANSTTQACKEGGKERSQARNTPCEWQQESAHGSYVSVDLVQAHAMPQLGSAAQRRGRGLEREPEPSTDLHPVKTRIPHVVTAGKSGCRRRAAHTSATVQAGLERPACGMHATQDSMSDGQLKIEARLGQAGNRCTARKPVILHPCTQ